MRRIGEELERTNAAKKTHFVRLPDLVIVDGGKGQLSSATAGTPAARPRTISPSSASPRSARRSSAPAKASPVVLPHETGALKLLQRIRDEAHRFANGYHQLLMKRRIAESILDDCPGISETRKTALLKRIRLRRPPPQNQSRSS